MASGLHVDKESVQDSVDARVLDSALDRLNVTDETTSNGEKRREDITEIMFAATKGISDWRVVVLMIGSVGDWASYSSS
jgi:hypothetical protein